MEETRCEFATVINVPREALHWLEEKLGYATETDNCFEKDENIVMNHDDGELLVASIDGCDYARISFLIEAVCEMQIKFNLEVPWHLTWAYQSVYSKQGAICGDAVVCFKGVTHRAMSLLKWVEETEANLLEGSDVSGS